MFDFSKNRRVSDINKVPENLRVFYEPDGEEFMLKGADEVTAAVAVITGQDKALRAVRKEADAAKAASTVDLSPLADFGDSVEGIARTVAAKIDELTEAAKGTEAIRGQIETVKREASIAHAKAIEEKDAQIEAINAQVADYIVTTQVHNAASARPGLNAKLIMPFVKPQMAVEVQEVDGQKVKKLVIKDASGQVRYSRISDRAGEPMDVSELLDEMAANEEYAALFPSKAKSGGGTPTPGPVQPGIRKSEKTDGMSSTQKIAAGMAARAK